MWSSRSAARGIFPGGIPICLAATCFCASQAPVLRSRVVDAKSLGTNLKSRGWGRKEVGFEFYRRERCEKIAMNEVEWYLDATLVAEAGHVYCDGTLLNAFGAGHA